MITNFEKGIITLIRCSLNGEKPMLDGDFDFEKAYEFAQNRQITPLIFQSASTIDGFLNTEVGKRFLQSTMRLSFTTAVQMEEINGITEKFRQEGVEFMIVKGTVIRVLYPLPEMRLMSDADILVREEQYEKIKEIMVAQDFVEQSESDHELVWQKGETTIELHKRLIPSYNTDYYKYFGDGWRLGKRVSEDNSEYVMNKEDSLIYLITHFAKHYRDTGIGVKHITDFYVFLEKNKDIDNEYLEGELEKLKLLEFWKNVKKLLGVWFYGEEWCELVEFLTLKIFSSGAFGTYESYVLAESIRMLKNEKDISSVARRKKLSTVFPSYKTMCKRYHFLKKVPILYPFMWVVRWVDLILFKRDRVKNRVDSFKHIREDKVNNYKNELKYVGLEFNFEEE